jgi:hypothetical protein
MPISEKTISKELYDAFNLFVYHTPTHRLSRNLRTLLMEYLIEHHDFLPPNFHDHVDDLSHLFDLLDKISHETKGWHDDETAITR